jgi:hypothetical protein
MKNNAVCFHGVSSGISDKDLDSKVNVGSVFDLIHSNIILPNNCDVFLHTWDHDNIDSVLSIYDPKTSCIEDPITFHENSLFDDIKHLRRKLLFDHDHKNRRNAILSRWYSLKKSVNLATCHAQESGFVYDKIFVTRFDMLLKKKVDLSVLSSEKFYTGRWPRWYDAQGQELNEIDVSRGLPFKFKGSKGFPFDSEGLHDFWFVANSESMSRFALCYDDLTRLFSQVGLSSHKITLQHLENLGLVEHLDFALEFPLDYTLGRWG